MDKNRVGINQIALLYLLSIAGGKFLTLPSILAKDVGHDSWLVLVFGFLWDAICLCFFVIFIIRANILLASCYKTFAVTFDVSTNWIVFVLPIAFLSFFAIKLGFNAIARTSQLLFGIIFISVLFLVLSPVSQVKITSLLPIGEAGWGKIIGDSFLRGFWFSDYLFVYFVWDSIKVKNNKVYAPILLGFAVGVALTVWTPFSWRYTEVWRRSSTWQ